MTKPTPSIVDETFLKVLESRSEYITESGCLIWMGCLGGKRDVYGRIRYLGRNMSTHRAAWIAMHGPIPDGLFVCHRCDIPTCIRPDHLFLGTPRDNAVDCKGKGRRTRQVGSRNSAAKLNENCAREIFRSNRKIAELAHQYGVSQSIVSEIKKGRKWAIATADLRGAQ